MTSALFATALVMLKGAIRVSLSELLLDGARLNNPEFCAVAILCIAQSTMLCNNIKTRSVYLRNPANLAKSSSYC